MRRRALAYLRSEACASCGGKRLGKAALSVRVAGLDIAEELSQLPFGPLS